MNALEIYLTSLFIILFFISFYIIFFDYKDIYIRRKDNILSVILYLITFLLIYIINKYNKYFLIINFTILISMLFNNKKTLFGSIFISFLISYRYSFIFSVLIYVLYYVLYMFYHIKSKSKLFLVNVFNVISSLFLIKYYSFSFIFFIFSNYILYFYFKKMKETLKFYKSLEEIEKDKRLKTSIFKVTHEIKNPLAVIKGYLSIFDPYDIEKSKRYLYILNKEVDNSLLVLKDFSSINHLNIVKMKMNFNELLNEIKLTVLPFFNVKNIQCYITCEDNLVINADYSRLKQVFINILKNSSEALRNNGIIKINAYKNNKNLIITIKDNGIGMDKDTIDNLFTPFYSKKSFGNGLGLCLSKEIIDNHGGNINYTSVINKYTLVKIVLPVN